MARSSIGLAYNWGVNDLDYRVTRAIDRKIIWKCPYYKVWRSMLCRCLSDNYKSRHKTYHDCTISEEWKYLSDFIKWVDSQPNKDWQNCCLDKDLLFHGNKMYSSTTCVFISSNLNRFLLDGATFRGNSLIGVNVRSKCEGYQYQAACNNPFNRGERYIGVFATELEAHRAWQAKKHEYACQLADLQDDPRVAKALRERYAPDKDWTNM